MCESRSFTRRRFMELSGLTVVTLTDGHPVLAADAPKVAPRPGPDTVLRKLLEGNKRFVKGDTVNPRRRPGASGALFRAFQRPGFPDRAGDSASLAAARRQSPHMQSCRAAGIGRRTSRCMHQQSPPGEQSK